MADGFYNPVSGLLEFECARCGEFFPAPRYRKYCRRGCSGKKEPWRKPRTKLGNPSLRVIPEEVKRQVRRDWRRKASLEQKAAVVTRNWKREMLRKYGPNISDDLWTLLEARRKLWMENLQENRRLRREGMWKGGYYPHLWSKYKKRKKNDEEL